MSEKQQPKNGVLSTCEVCGNDYDKAFQVTLGGATHVFRQFRVRDSRARSHVQPLRLSNPRSWRRERTRRRVLLRILREAGGG